MNLLMHCDRSIAEGISDGRLPGLPRLIVLDDSYAEEVCCLEPYCYTSPWSSRLIQGEFQKDVSYRMGLKQAGRLVAYSFSYLIPEDLHILNLAVVPEWRGNGYGKYLLSSLLLQSYLHGVRYTSLEVRQSNIAAQRLYRALGFACGGVRQNYYRDNGEDALLMERNLHLPDYKYLERFSRSALKI